MMRMMEIVIIQTAWLFSTTRKERAGWSVEVFARLAGNKTWSYTTRKLKNPLFIIQSELETIFMFVHLVHLSVWDRHSTWCTRPVIYISISTRMDLGNYIELAEMCSSVCLIVAGRRRYAPRGWLSVDCLQRTVSYHTKYYVPSRGY